MIRKQRAPNCNGCGRWMIRVGGSKDAHERVDYFACDNCGRETAISTPLVNATCRQ